MRLLHVIRTLDPAAGGPPVVATRLAAAQAALGHEVQIVSYEAAPPVALVETMMAGVPHGAAVRCHGLPRDGLLENVRAVGAGRWMRDVLPGIDFVHLHCIWSPMLVASAAQARRLHVPYALVPHGALDPWSLRQRRLKKKIALRLGFRAMVDGAAFLHALNADEARLIGPLHVRCPIEVVPNGIFLEEVASLPAPGTFRNEHPELDRRPYILFLSRLHYKKGLDYLADALKLLRNRQVPVDVVVAGPDDGAGAAFARQVAEAGLRERVHVVGPLYGPAKLAALVDATCFCLPSRQEGFSIAIIEAMACGLPVVISDQCHFPEVAEAGAGLVVPLQATTIASALERVLTDARARAAMGAAARTLVAARYTWPAVAARTIALYQQYGNAR